ncbi:MAG TPA: hypothetical protein VJJ52_07155 [Candidatus Nanoarchaeia archaeon]|nr:hypothetical protein [Candidatus Nanoarchaeia archaeon]
MVYIAAVGITTVIFGIGSLLLISRARNKLTDGSIRRFMDNFAICLAFIVTFSVWQALRDIYQVGGTFNVQTNYLSYPEYIFIIFAYIAFIITSFRTQKISEEFGFKDAGKKIVQIIKSEQKTAVPAPGAEPKQEVIKNKENATAKKLVQRKKKNARKK